MRQPWFVAIRWCSIAWALFMAIGCTGITPETSRPTGDGASVPRRLQDRQVIVTLAPASPERLDSIIDDLARAYNLTRLGVFLITALGVQCIRFQVPEDRSIDAAIGRLAADPRVESVQLNQRFRGLGVVYNDKYASLQYGARVIRADAAHRWATGKGVKVAVVDTGVAIGHPDLLGQIGNHANFVDGGDKTFAQEIHGTEVAGVIAARAGNGIGIFGIAPEASVVALKACWQLNTGQAECSSWTLLKALDHAINKAEVRLLNLSLGGPPDKLLRDLLEVAEHRGITVVAAAQKEGPSAPGFPASLPTVIGVLASDLHGKVDGAPGGKPTRLLAAPGIDILTTVPPKGYNEVRGSSLAAAHVTGVVALLLERAPGLSPIHVRAILGTTARPAKSSGGMPQPTIGVVDAYAALERLLRIQASSQGIDAHASQRKTAAMNPK
jgi:subtilisin family serine protease